ncbi:RNA 2',3'-cyclic phosphodiesterase [Actinoplanes sp. NPDC026619]|uniref:RNA 2',3'-cyclic phosphodiesterase n=1 Tax=Actinoplanes sp. NPDC026619 TaxID=3155798 RepID=UPI0033D984C1
MFVALYPPPSELSALSRALPSGSRLTRAAKWHVTLVFLGDIPVTPVAVVLDGIVAPPQFALHLHGGGQFGNAAWARVEGDLGPLGELRSEVRDALAHAGFPSDDRPYRPHLTVSYRSDDPIRTALANYRGSPWRVTEFALVESHNGEYKTVQKWPLAA